MGPLSALRFVASHGVGILHLQGVEIGIFLQFAQAFALLRNVGVVLHHFLKQRFLLFARQGGRLSSKGIKEHGGLQLAVVVVGKL